MFNLTFIQCIMENCLSQIVYKTVSGNNILDLIQGNHN